MADLDAELLRFQAEIAVEEDVHKAAPAGTISDDSQDKLGYELARFEAEITAVERDKKRAATATLSAKPLKKPTTVGAAVLPQPARNTTNAGPRNAGYHPSVPPRTDPQAAGWNTSMPPAPYAVHGGSNTQIACGYMDEGHKAKLQAEAVANVKAALAKAGEQKEKTSATHYRQAAGKAWVDETLSEWPEGDHRIFVGDLGSEVNDELLSKAFHNYKSFNKAKIVRDKRSGKSKGFGFVSMQDAADFAKALREMNGKYIGNRPCKLSKSSWAERANSSVPVNKKKGGKAPAIGKAKFARNHIPLG